MTMPASPSPELVERIADVFRQYGYDGTSLDRLSEATRLPPSALRTAFPNGKPDMAQAVLGHAHAWFLQHVFEPLRAPGPPRSRLERMAKALDRYYHHGRAACLLELFAVSDYGGPLHAYVRRLILGFIDQLAEVVAETGVERDLAARRAEDAVIDLQGALVVSRGLQSTEPFRRTLATLADRLLSSG